MKLILLNSPPETGKTVAVDFLKNFYNLTERRCKDRLHEITRYVFDVPERDYWEIYNTRVLKNAPNAYFAVKTWAVEQLKQVKGMENDKYFYCKSTGMWHLTIRQAMIYTSECLVKPSFGEDYFGKYRADSIQPDEIAIDDSVGFEAELYPSIEKLGQENILLIRILGRADFDGGDSRSYMPDGLIENTVDVYNDDTLEVFLERMLRVVKRFLE